MHNANVQNNFTQCTITQCYQKQLPVLHAHHLDSVIDMHINAQLLQWKGNMLGRDEIIIQSIIVQGRNHRLATIYNFLPTYITKYGGSL